MKKPHIYWVFYPKSKRGYWLVEKMPVKAWLIPGVKTLWSAAYTYVRKLNDAIGVKIEAERLAKKRKPK